MKDKKRGNVGGGFYIALCVSAVVVALISYVGNAVGGNKKSPEPQKLAMEDIQKLPEFPEKKIVEPDIITLEPEPEPEPQLAQTAAEEEVYEFLPAMPAAGKVIAEFSNKTPVLFERFGDWRTHNGIDIEAEVGEDVYVCESGVIEKIYRNNLGGCVLVDHKNGYKSLYANLGQIDLVAVGDEVYTGETIGRAGEASLGDLSAVPHVHFELYYEGKAIDPLSKITVE